VIHQYSFSSSIWTAWNNWLPSKYSQGFATYTKKIVVPQHLADSQELKPHPIAQPEQEQPETPQVGTQILSQADAPQQPAVAIQVEPIVEDKAWEKENEIAEMISKTTKIPRTKRCQQTILPILHK
jgi:hypothetical protein